MSESQIPTSRLRRGLIAGRTATMMAISKITRLTQEQNLQQQAIAKVLFQGLSQLRGTALKFAQILSSEDDLLPEAYTKELRKSQYKVPPLNKALTYKILQQEFKKNPLELYDVFEMEAFAGASLGQVHRAKKDQKELAVKIQYPGIASTIKNDIAIMRKIISVLPHHLLLSRSLDELAERIYEETDYLKEAQETEWFYDQFNSESVNIPIVLKELTTSRVLTTTLLQGKHIDEWIMDAPPQEAKNKACKILYEFFFESLFKHSKIHADPHLGNFLFQEDGSIGVIDFGSVKALPEPALILYQELWKAALNQDYSKLIPLYKDLGAEIEGEDEDRFLKVCVIPYCEWLSFFLDQECDFENMSEQISLGKAILLKNIYEKTLQNFSTDFVLVHRTFYGLLRAFERIGGRARLNVVFS